MKRLLQLVLLLLVAARADAGISLVQKGSLGSSGASSVTSETSLLSTPVGAGDLIVVAVRYGNPTSQGTISVSDNVNGSYTQAYDGNDPGDGRQLALFYFANSAASAAGLTVSCDVTSGNILSCASLEYSGAAATNPLDGIPAVSVFGTPTATPSSGNVTPTQSGDLAVGSLLLAAGVPTTVTTESASFTTDFDLTGSDTAPHGHYAQAILTGTAGITYSPTLSADSSGIIAVALFKPAEASAPPPPSGTVQTVFVILMENENLSSFTLTRAPYLTGTLVSSGALATQYYNPPNNHPSEPNYVWLEAGDNEGLTTDKDPSSSNSTATTQHLATYLSNAGLAWREYAENISGTDCPLVSNTNSLDSTSTAASYSPRHVPFLFLQDLTNGESSTSPTCIANVRPYSQLATDLANGTVARYNFITPNGTDDIHDSNVETGDKWLSQNVPAILNSPAFQNNGALLITFDEGGTGDGPIPMIVLSPLAKVNYTNSIHYDHSSTVLTLQEIFGVGPCLRNACGATDLADLFQPGAIPALPMISVAINPISAPLVQSQQQQFTATVTGSGNTAVNWTTTPAGLGTITNAGLYTAPSSITSAQTVQVTATSQADATKSATATITLQPPDFALSVSPASQTVIQGDSATYTVSVAAAGGFSGAVSLSTGTLPSGLSASFGPTSSTQTSTMTVTTSASTTPGTYAIPIAGTSGSTTHQASASIAISPSAAPTHSISGTITPAASGAGTTVTLSGGVPTLVSTAQASSPAGSSSVSAAFPSTAVSADAVVVFLRFGGTVASVTDNQSGGSNTYTSVLGPTQWGVAPGPTDRFAQVFVAKNITGGTNLSITVTLAAPSTYDLHIVALEYSGVDPNNPVNATGAGTGTVITGGGTPDGAPAPMANLTTTVANTKLVATSWDSNESYLPASDGIGYATNVAAGTNSISGGTGWSNLTEDATASLPGSYGASTNTARAVTDWVMQLIALAPAQSLTTAITDGSGNYSFAGLANGVYTVTPSVTGLAFSPASQAVTLSGTDATGVNFAVVGAPAVSLSATSLTFDNQPTGTTSAAQTVTLTNTGDQPLPITAIAVTGAANTDYALPATAAPCGASLAAGASCGIDVTFTPGAAGMRPATITITDGATGSPQTITLNGTGTTS